MIYKVALPTAALPQVTSPSFPLWVKWRGEATAVAKADAASAHRPPQGLWAVEPSMGS